MGLDGEANFFYGMPLDHCEHELCSRDELRGKRRCLKCKKVMESKFCPDDGENTEIIETPVGWDALYEGYPEAIPEMEGLDVVAMENEGPHYLYVKESLVRAGDLRGGSGRRDSCIPLGQSLTPNLGWESKIKELCKALGVGYVGAQYFIGLYLSY